MILLGSLGSSLAGASTVFAAVAAIATIVAVVYARKTVQESEAASKAMAKQHREQIAELKAAAAAADAASQKELLGRRIAFDHDLAIQRLAQLQRIADALTELIHVAREERTHPSEQIMDIQPGRAVSSTRIPAPRDNCGLRFGSSSNCAGPTCTRSSRPRKGTISRLGFSACGSTAWQPSSGSAE